MAFSSPLPFGARVLPLFPLPVVLFPGGAMPLHIFEPRYRSLLADCLDGDRRFGLIYLPPEVDERALPAGHVGCVARIESTQELPDGRSNIIIAGEDRFALVRFVESASPYHSGEVVAFEDEPENGTLTDELAERVTTRFARVGRAARTLADDPDPLPPLPDDPGPLSFAIASMIDLDGPARQELLASRSASFRLSRLDVLLSTAVGALEPRAAMHLQAKGNGRGPAANP